MITIRWSFTTRRIAKPSGVVWRWACGRYETGTIPERKPGTPGGQQEAGFGALFAQRFFDDADDALHVQRLRDIHAPADLALRSAQLLLLDRGGQKHHGRFAQRRVLFQTGGDVSAVHVRHHDVEQDQVRLELLRGLEHPRAKILLAHLVVARSFEVQFQQPGDAGLIIGHQNSFLAHDPSFRCVLNMTVTLTPPSLRLMIRIIPPYNSTTFFSTIKSRTPFRINSVANARSDLSASLLSMTPGPSSSTSAATTVSPAFNWPGVRPLQPSSLLNCLRKVLTVSVPPPDIAWIEPSNRLMKTCLTVFKSIRTGGRPEARSLNNLTECAVISLSTERNDCSTIRLKSWSRTSRLL